MYPPTKGQLDDCIAKFKGTTIEKVERVSSKMGNTVRVIVKKEGIFHSIDFVKMSTDHVARVYKGICDYPYLPAEQGETLPETARKTVDKWGITNPKNVKI